MSCETSRIPIVDISSLVNQEEATDVANRIADACRESGFFYIVGHGIRESLQDRLEELSRQFFAQDEQEKLRISMQRGGRAWRGYFPVGAELTAGKPDQKEGLYFGSELSGDHPKVRQGLPLHGPNLFPPIADFRVTVLEYLDRMTELGHTMMRGIAFSLGLHADYFRRELTADPTILFRIFHYPPLPSESTESLWSVGEHTDYGLLTILKQDDAGGLEVKSGGRWMKAPPIRDAFVCNIGDMLDRMTRGLYRSTPHRVRNSASRGRCSFPFFFDPGWDAEVRPIVQAESSGSDDRWDGARLEEIQGTYGDYLMRKVSKVFPQLSQDQL